MNEVGAKVRMYHGSYTGVIVAHAAPSPRDGTERVVIEWDTPEGVTRSSWSPRVLVPFDTPKSQDPPAVLIGENLGLRVYLTKYGVRTYNGALTQEEVNRRAALPTETKFTPLGGSMWRVERRVP